MCGIVGYKGDRKASELLLEGLKKVEYRGYDSVGMAINNNREIIIEKDIGKVEEVDRKLNFRRLDGTVGIAHTRWGTHGKISKENAHPHLSNNKKIAVVHNGIVENYQELRNFLISRNFTFESETDTEIIPNLIEYHTQQGETFLSAMRKTFLEIKGSYAVVIMQQGDSKLYFARCNSPLVLGLGNKAGNETGTGNEDGNEIFIASDAPAFLNQTNKVIYLEDGEYGYYDNKLHIFDLETNNEINKKIEEINWTAEQAQKQDYPHFMLKEINEQGETIKKAMEQPAEVLEKATELIKNAFGVFLVGCGTSYHACISAAYQFSHIANKHMNIVLASEFRNYEEFLTDKTLIIAVSQSGETADLLDAVKTAKKKNSKIMAIVNVMGSTLQRTSDLSIMMQAGPEICVVSTKSYTAQLAILLLLAYSTAGRIEEGRRIIRKAAESVKEVIEKNNKRIERLAQKTRKKKDYFLIGRDLAYPSALEGALKIKETSYIHAEGFAGGELKHGTIALIEKGSPVITLATQKTESLIVSNAEEIKARGGYIIGINSKKNKVYDYFLKVPDADQANPLLMIIPIQLLAYYLAVKRGCDADKPRNLAKSVTVK